MFIGAIADDLTGATDLALTLSRGGLRVLQLVGVPREGAGFGDAEAVVISLKSRTIRAGDAVAQSLASAEALLAGGARQLFFKYSSTFDSTDAGNIGPVIDALLDRLGEKRTIACPAFPTNRRTVYQGHLFVGRQLLANSPMKDHPLTPMRDSDLVAVLGRQSRNAISLIPHEVVAEGAEGLEAALAGLKGVAIVDAITDADLRAIGKAAAGLKLVTGGSGVALGLPANFLDAPRPASNAPMDAPAGRAVVLAGSCSAATRRQVETAKAAGLPSMRLDPVAIAMGELTPAAVTAFATAQERTPLIYSSADAAEVGAVQQRLGRERAGQVVEHFLAEVARQLRESGFSRFVVAGGETSGAVVEALGVTGLRIGPEIDPGVPWTRSHGGPDLALALKSGNFGADDFFTKAWQLLR